MGKKDATWENPRWSVWEKGIMQHVHALAKAFPLVSSRNILLIETKRRKT